MPTEEKLDLYKENKAEYAAPKKPALITSRKAQYLAISGSGQPGGNEYQTRIGALYGMAFTIKMTRKFEGKGDYAVCKLEGQYWSDPPREGSSFEGPLDDLQWRLLIRTPDFIKKRDLKQAAAKLIEKKGLVEAEEVELVSLAEGRCVQMLHVGPYDEEARTVEQMMEFTDAEKLVANGHHHRISQRVAKRAGARGREDKARADSGAQAYLSVRRAHESSATPSSWTIALAQP